METKEDICSRCKTIRINIFFRCTKDFDINGGWFCKYCRNPVFKRECECYMYKDRQTCDPCIDAYYRAQEDCEDCDECREKIFDHQVTALGCLGCTWFKFIKTYTKCGVKRCNNYLVSPNKIKCNSCFENWYADKCTVCGEKRKHSPCSSCCKLSTKELRSRKYYFSQLTKQEMLQEISEIE